METQTQTSNIISSNERGYPCRYDTERYNICGTVDHPTEYDTPGVPACQA